VDLLNEIGQAHIIFWCFWKTSSWAWYQTWKRSL